MIHLALIILFFLIKKRNKKNQGKHKASGYFASPTPRDQSAFFKSNSQPKPFFSYLLKIVTSSIIISAAVHTYDNIKIEKYHGRNHLNKNHVWVSIKLNAVFILVRWLRLRVKIKCRSHSSAKAEHSCFPKKGCNLFRGSFFGSFLEDLSRFIGKQKRTVTKHAAINYFTATWKHFLFFGKQKSKREN